MTYIISIAPRQNGVEGETDAQGSYDRCATAVTTAGMNTDSAGPIAAIRPASSFDAHRLSTFARRTFRETFAAQNTPEDLNVYLSSAFNDSRQLSEIEDPHTVTLLAESGETLVGYAQSRLGEPPRCVPDRHAIELVRFYVDRALHGRGLAHTLMRAALEAASPRARTMWLGVWERNARAIAFYEKWGFVDVGSHVFVLGSDRQTDRIMWRTALSNRPADHMAGQARGAQQ
jgi:ribosomal protein S18 acetylase RimI-like enzyme